MQDTWFEQAECADCGEFFSPPEDSAFWVTDRTFICFQCAVRRGGIYDTGQDRWSAHPNLSGIDDERRPHA